jgi:thymidylate synthase (FAD)
MGNTVELIGYYGSDETHAGSAWISNSIEVKDRIDEIPRLLNFLIENEHGTPFEKSYIQFRVTCEQASHIHLLKHRIAVPINGESARYGELKEDRFYIPNDWIPNPEIHTEKQIHLLEYYSGELNDLTKRTNELYHSAVKDLKGILEPKRAKESARFFKMMNSQLRLDVSFNFRSFMHFLELRNSPHAQLEIREIAQEMLNLVKNIESNPFRYSIEAFEKQMVLKQEFQQFIKQANQTK